MKNFNRYLPWGYNSYGLLSGDIKINGSIRFPEIASKFKIQDPIIDKIKGSEPFIQSGGSVTNSIYTLSQLGGSGYLSFLISDDEYGKLFLEDIRKSGINTGDVNSLTNANELPFVCTVGCKSGDFGDGTCLGEEFLRSTSGSSPTGAIGTFMSTIYQGWAPPMEAQDEMVDILTESFSNNRKYSFGGISWNGCLEMNDNYGSDGDSETDHWTLFGDPSIELRTNTPSNLSISHTGLISPEDGVYEVIINGDHDNVIAALSSDGMYLGSAYSDNGSSIIIVNEDISTLSSVTLTVTGYNTLTVIETAPVYEDSPHLTLVIVGRFNPVDVDVPASPPIATRTSSSALVLSLPVAALFLIIQPLFEAKALVIS